jgi:hypothetical protein
VQYSTQIASLQDAKRKSILINEQILPLSFFGDYLCEKQNLPLMAQNTFFQELKRRNVFKVASIYAVTAWLIIQVAAVAFPAFEFPIWTQRLVIILAIIGFPIALILAWAQES